MWTTATALEAFINALRTADTELAAFQVQHTVYGIFIAVEALLCGEGTYDAAGDKYTMDAVSYDLGAGIPPALIGAHGLLEDAADEFVCRDLLVCGAALIRGFSVVRWADELTRMEDAFGAACAERPEWNYYGAVGDDGILPAEREERVRGLGTAIRDVVEAEAEAAVAVPPSRKNRTRRVHGRRALTPVRSRRGASTTRRH